jgi:hypothetical protein
MSRGCLTGWVSNIFLVVLIPEDADFNPNIITDVINFNRNWTNPDYNVQQQVTQPDPETEKEA